ncbi:MAG: hypothetical protein QOK14_711 [Frankiaceae bacterium]|nr:hypothetical protein [Frankiaceae bacterium]
MGRFRFHRNRRPRPGGREANPLEPIATATDVLLGLVLAGLLITVVATAFGSGSLFGFGGPHASVCVDRPGYGSSDPAPFVPLRPGANLSVMTTGLRLCTDAPTTAERVWYSILVFPSGALLIGALWLMRRVVGEAARGIYTRATALRLRTLGRYLVAGCLVQLVVEQVASGRLLNDFLIGGAPIIGAVRFRLDIAAVLAGVAVLSWARVMRIGAQMRDDLEGTV